MRVDVKKIDVRHQGHKTLIETMHTPNWFERVVLRMKAKTERFIGHKKVWSWFPSMEPITNKTDLKHLEELEKKGVYLVERKGGRNLAEEKQKRDAARAERKRRREL